MGRKPPADRRRAALAAAVVVTISALAASALVAKADDAGPRQDTVLICHSLGGGRYVAVLAPESSLYGAFRVGHGLDANDIVPPFTVESPGPGDASSFPGRNWDDRGQEIYDAGCATAALRAGPPTKVRICHATSSTTNPYVSEEPAIANNGDLKGGHLNHTGPVYPAPGWGDIIPPYEYVDENGDTQTFPGYNWSEEGQAIYGNGCEPLPPPQPQPVTPTLECVEASGSGFLAHFGYDNPNATTVEPSPGENAFSPPPANRGQPTAFAAGQVADAFQVSWNGSDLTWSLTGKSVTASSGSPRCQGSITVTKQLLPADDPGRFDLEIDGDVAGGAAAVGDRGTTGTIAVGAGQHAVGESGATGTSLDDYRVQIVCRGNGGAGDVVAEGSGPSLNVRVSRGVALVCTITNQARGESQDVSPVLECVVFDGETPQIADWGYTNSSGVPVVIPVGPKNHFSPVPAGRGQPVAFQTGSYVGVFQTPFDDGVSSLSWTLSGRTVIASASSPRCTATVEVRKVVIPSSDPGLFNLEINGVRIATGGDGTTTGPVLEGVGEATVSETAGPNTSLADYSSSVSCTRNGSAEVSVPGTKVDGTLANGDVVVCIFQNVRNGTPIPPIPPKPPEPPIPPVPPIVPPEPPPGPKPLLDLEVVKTAKPSVVVVGGRITWTMTVTNRSAVEAADVNGLKVNDPQSYRTKLISLTTSQGTCRPYVCNLGRLAPGESATVVAVTRASQVGTVVDIVRVGSEEVESDYRNNTASALARVVGPLRPPVAATCRTLTAAPRVLQAKRSSVVLVTAHTALGRPMRGLTVRALGAGVATRGRTDRSGVARLTMMPTRIGLVVFAGSRRRVIGRPACRTFLASLEAKPTHVTG